MGAPPAGSPSRITCTMFGSYMVTLTVTDDNVPGKTATTRPGDRRRPGQPRPTADAAGPCRIDIGADLTSTGRFGDADQPYSDAIVAYAWDLGGRRDLRYSGSQPPPCRGRSWPFPHRRGGPDPVARRRFVRPYRHGHNQRDDPQSASRCRCRRAVHHFRRRRHAGPQRLGLHRSRRRPAAYLHMDGERHRIRSQRLHSTSAHVAATPGHWNRRRAGDVRHPVCWSTTATARRIPSPEVTVNNGCPRRSSPELMPAWTKERVLASGLLHRSGSRHVDRDGGRMVTATAHSPWRSIPTRPFLLEHTYPDDGVYIVRVTVTDDDGDSGFDEFDVDGHESPAHRRCRPEPRRSCGRRCRIGLIHLHGCRNGGCPRQ